MTGSTRPPDHASPTPAVSVVMPVYDAAAYVEGAVRSILDQTWSDFEFLIFDDGSRDASPAIVARLAGEDSRVVAFQRAHGGLTALLNEGIEKSRGEFLARMDADDVAHPERLDRQLDYLRQHPECVAVGTGALEVDPEGMPIQLLGVTATHGEIEAQLLAGVGHAVLHPSALYRRDALLRVGGYRPELEGGEDLDLHLRLAEVGSLANLPEILLEYRRHPASVSLRRGLDRHRAHDAAIREAAARRGIDLAGLPRRRPPAAVVPAHEVHALWANRALESRYLATARKHAWRAFRAAPFRHWKLPIRAGLGIRPYLWARWRAALRRDGPSA
jgi:glycosyltransferase involved in cell wall biosynthesis